eukprot:COSAG01_NODE_4798_length_4738_cov_3.104980_7_plen_121_part_00
METPRQAQRQADTAVWPALQQRVCTMQRWIGALPPHASSWARVWLRQSRYVAEEGQSTQRGRCVRAWPPRAAVQVREYEAMALQKLGGETAATESATKAGEALLAMQPTLEANDDGEPLP